MVQDGFPRSSLTLATRVTAFELSITWRVNLGSGVMVVTLGSVPGHMTCEWHPWPTSTNHPEVADESVCFVLNLIPAV